MKKFIVKTTYEKDSISKEIEIHSYVMEVDLKLVPAIDDPSVMWLPSGEYKAYVIAPRSLYEKQDDGSLTPPQWYSHAFYDSEAEALLIAQKQIREIFDREMRHYRVEYTEQEIQEKLSQITIHKL